MAEILQRFDYIRRFHQEMKRNILILLILCVAAQTASAQWYLFPGSPARRDTARTKQPVPDTAVTVELPGIQDSVEGVCETEESLCDSSMVEDNSIAVSLILPLHSAMSPSSNFLDFYSGALLAAGKLAESGVDLKLRVIDCTCGLPPYDEVNTSDVIIGPVDVEDIIPVSRMCAGGICAISPLEPKVASLTGEYNIIQAPSRWEAQIDELVSWLASETARYDSVVLLQNSMEEGGEAAPYLVSRLNDYGIVYSISGDVENAPVSKSGCTRYVLVSENSTFCAECVRDVALKAVKEERVALYSTSKLRSIGDIEPASLHAAGARITATYYADPHDPAVAAFVADYLRMFHAEPSSFAYQGYDLTNYFVTVCSMYRDGWQLYLTDHPWSGLHTDFRFVDSVMAGRINTAVRRLRYLGNNEIKVEKK